jgi:hypothetical protein
MSWLDGRLAQEHLKHVPAWNAAGKEVGRSETEILRVIGHQFTAKQDKNPRLL